MAYSNLGIEDIYAGNTNPTANINPKRLGAFYINYITGETFTCINNNLNANKWSHILIQDKWKDLGNINGNYSLNFGGANNDYNNFWLTLTGTTKFTTVVTTNAKERSGLLVVKSGGANLQQMFTNAYWSFTVPILSAPNASSNGSYLVFPYKLMPTGLVIITRC